MTINLRGKINLKIQEFWNLLKMLLQYICWCNLELNLYYHPQTFTHLRSRVRSETLILLFMLPIPILFLDLSHYINSLHQFLSLVIIVHISLLFYLFTFYYYFSLIIITFLNIIELHVGFRIVVLLFYVLWTRIITYMFVCSFLLDCFTF